MMILTTLFLVSCDKTINDETVSVVFYTGPGATTIPTLYNLERGQKITPPEEPTSDSAVFVGWFKEPTYVTPWNFETDTVNKSLTIFAKWEYRLFTITYDLRGGSWPADLPEGTYRTTYMSNESFNFPTQSKLYPTHETNGLFLGWWPAPDLNRQQRRDIPKVEGIAKGTTGDITLYAYYSREP
jgi:uncharacterized repeat protein (TIGR02543 family)